MNNVLPTAADVVDAHARLRGWLVETPVLESESINRRVGARVLFKAECLQHSGSFKIRGALNRLLQLERRRAPGRRRGVLVGQSRASRRAGGALARRSRRRSSCPPTRRRSSSSARAHTAPRSCSTTASARIARRSPRGSLSSAAPRSCRRSTTRTSSRGRARSRSSSAASARGRHLRRRRALRALQRRRSRRRLRARNQGRVAGLRCLCRRAARVRGHGGIAGCGRAAYGCCPAARRCATGCVRRRPARSRSRSIGASSRARCAVDDEQIRAAMVTAAQELKVVVEPSGAAALAAVLAEPRPKRSVCRRHTVGRQRRRRPHCRCAANPRQRNDAG